MKQIIKISTEYQGDDIEVSGGDGCAFTFKTQSMEMIEVTHYPNLTINADPLIEQRVADLEAKEHFINTSQISLNEAQQDYLNA